MGFCGLGIVIWVVVKIMVPFWVPIIIRHLLFRYPKRDPVSASKDQMSFSLQGLGCAARRGKFGV